MGEMNHLNEPCSLIKVFLRLRCVALQGHGEKEMAKAEVWGGLGRETAPEETALAPGPTT